MATIDTYRKGEDGKIYLRHIETKNDINEIEFTIIDKEVEFNTNRHLPRLQTDLSELRTEISKLQTEETRLINKIAAIETAVASKVLDN